MHPTTRLGYGKTFVLGLGFLTTAVSWSLFNSYVPIFLKAYVTSAALIGFVMTLDNWAAILIQPWIGAVSDRTKTRLGRRMPYIAVGIPIASAFFCAIPLLSRGGGAERVGLFSLGGKLIEVSPALLPLFLVIMGFNVAMALYRAPVVALMPDVTPSIHRSTANGIINFMGGAGSILAFLGGSFLYELGAPVPFAVAAAVMVLALVALLVFVREPPVDRPSVPEKAEERPGVIASLRSIVSEREFSTLFILGAIFCWFFAYNGIETWFTTYGVDVLGIRENVAARMVTAVALAFVVFALPAGFIGARLGRKRTILLGLALFIADLAVLVIVRKITVLWVLLAIAGVAWALINVNSITIVWELGKARRVGTYTGLYYFASALAQIVSPPLLGLLIDRAGMGVLFPSALGFMILAALLMLGVRRGEARESEEAAVAEGELKA